MIHSIFHVTHGTSFFKLWCWDGPPYLSIVSHHLQLLLIFAKRTRKVHLKNNLLHFFSAPFLSFLMRMTGQWFHAMGKADPIGLIGIGYYHWFKASPIVIVHVTFNSMPSEQILAKDFRGYILTWNGSVWKWFLGQKLGGYKFLDISSEFLDRILSCYSSSKNLKVEANRKKVMF